MLSAFHFEVLDWSTSIFNWLIRLAIAAVCGFAIGFERKARSKEAGIRTHTIVCFAAALMMIISKYCFIDLFGASTDPDSVGAGTRGADPARIAAQVVSGIGFLGAGIIFYKHDLLHGLTTAAGIWATAGIGMAIGSGMLVIGVVSTVVLVLLQLLLHRPWKIFRSKSSNFLRILLVVTDGDVLDKVKDIFHINKVLKFKTGTNKDGEVTADMEVTTDIEFTTKELYEFTREYDFIRSIEKTDEI